MSYRLYSSFHFLRHLKIRGVLSLFIILSLVLTDFPLDWVQAQNKVLSTASYVRNSTEGQKGLKDIRIPAKFGDIRERFQGPSKQYVIQIQDAHCHFEAQSNVARILSELFKGHESHGLKMVNIEGASGVVDTSLLTSFPDPEMKKQLALYYLKQGRISGAEYLSIIRDQALKIRGVEDLGLYFTNLISFRSAQSRLKKSARTFNQLESALQFLQEKINSPALKDFLNHERSYETSQMTLDKFLKYLRALSKKKNVQMTDLKDLRGFFKASKVGEKIDYTRVEKEQAEVLAQMMPKLDQAQSADILAKGLLLRLEKIAPEEYFHDLSKVLAKKEIRLDAWPNFSKYLLYLKLFRRVNKSLLFQELEIWEKRIKQTLLETPEERELDRQWNYFVFLKSLCHLELVREDLSFLKTDSPLVAFDAFRSFSENSSSKYHFKLPTQSQFDSLRENLPSLKKFYDTALAREEVLVNQALSQAKDANSPISVLIAGGFHTDGIAQKLKERGVSYLVVMPKITNIHAKTPYLSIMQDKRSTLEKKLAKEIFKEKPSSAIRQASVSPGKGLETQNSKLETQEQGIIMHHGSALGAMSTFQDVDALIAFLTAHHELDDSQRAVVLKKIQMLEVDEVFSPVLFQFLASVQGRSWPGLLDAWWERLTRQVDQARRRRIENPAHVCKINSVELIGSRFFIDCQLGETSYGIIVDGPNDGRAPDVNAFVEGFTEYEEFSRIRNEWRARHGESSQGESRMEPAAGTMRVTRRRALAGIAAFIGSAWVLGTESRQAVARPPVERKSKSGTTDEQGIQDALKEMAPFHAPGVSYDAQWGTTYDAHSIDYDSGELLGGPRNLSAPSKESLHIQILVLAMKGNPRAQAYISPQNPRAAYGIAKNILTRKITAFERFARMYPRYGGFLPWFTTDENGIHPDFSNPQEQFPPGLDNGQFAWAMYMAYHALKEAGESDLTQRYKTHFDLLAKNAVKMFYEPSSGKIRGQVKIARPDAREEAFASDYAVYNENYYLTNAYEDELMAFFVTFFGDWSEHRDGSDKIWREKRTSRVNETVNGKPITLMEGAGFPVYLWKFMILPYSDNSTAKQIFENGEKFRAGYARSQGFAGFFAPSAGVVNDNTETLRYSANSATPLKGASTKQDILTPCAFFALFLVKPSCALEWLRHYLRIPKAKGPHGLTEAVAVDARQISPLVSWDVNGLLALGMMGGVSGAIGKYLREDGHYDQFNRIVGRQMEVFADRPIQGPDAGFAEPAGTPPHPSNVSDFKASPSDVTAGRVEGKGGKLGDYYRRERGASHFSAERGHVEFAIQNVDVRKNPVLTLKVKTRGAARIYLVIKDSKKRLMTSGKIILNLPDTHGEFAVCSINLAKVLKQGTSVAAFAVFSDSNGVIEMRSATFELTAPQGFIAIPTGGLLVRAAGSETEEVMPEQGEEVEESVTSHVAARPVLPRFQSETLKLVRDAWRQMLASLREVLAQWRDVNKAALAGSRGYWDLKIVFILSFISNVFRGAVGIILNFLNPVSWLIDAVQWGLAGTPVREGMAFGPTAQEIASLTGEHRKGWWGRFSGRSSTVVPAVLATAAFLEGCGVPDGDLLSEASVTTDDETGPTQTMIPGLTGPGGGASSGAVKSVVTNQSTEVTRKGIPSTKWEWDLGQNGTSASMDFENENQNLDIRPYIQMSQGVFRTYIYSKTDTIAFMQFRDKQGQSSLVLIRLSANKWNRVEISERMLKNGLSFAQVKSFSLVMKQDSQNQEGSSARSGTLYMEPVKMDSTQGPSTTFSPTIGASDVAGDYRVGTLMGSGGNTQRGVAVTGAYGTMPEARPASNVPGVNPSRLVYTATGTGLTPGDGVADMYVVADIAPAQRNFTTGTVVNGQITLPTRVTGANSVRYTLFSMTGTTVTGIASGVAPVVTQGQFRPGVVTVSNLPVGFDAASIGKVEWKVDGTMVTNPAGTVTISTDALAIPLITSPKRAPIEEPPSLETMEETPPQEPSVLQKGEGEEGPAGENVPGSGTPFPVSTGKPAKPAYTDIGRVEVDRDGNLKVTDRRQLSDTQIAILTRVWNILREKYPALKGRATNIFSDLDTVGKFFNAYSGLDSDVLDVTEGLGQRYSDRTIAAFWGHEMVDHSSYGEILPILWSLADFARMSAEERIAFVREVGEDDPFVQFLIANHARSREEQFDAVVQFVDEYELFKSGEKAAVTAAVSQREKILEKLETLMGSPVLEAQSLLEKPIYGHAYLALLKSVLAELLADVASSNQELLAEVNQTVERLVIRQTTLKDLNELVNRVVTARFRQEDGEGNAEARAAMRKGVLMVFLQMADALQRGRASPVAIYEFVERYVSSPEAVDQTRTLSDVLAGLDTLKRGSVDASRVLEGAATVRGLANYFNALELIRLGKVKEGFEILRALAKSENKELAVLSSQTLAKVLDTSEQNVEIKGQSVDAVLARLRNDAGIAHIDFATQRISPEHYEQIFAELNHDKNISAITIGDEVHISGFADGAVVRVKKNGNVLKVTVLSEDDRYDLERTARMPALVKKVEKREGKFVQIQDHRTLGLSVKKDQEGRPIRVNGKLQIEARGSDFARYYLDEMGMLTGSDGKPKVNFLISWVVEEGINPAEISQEDVLGAILGESYQNEKVRAIASKNIRVKVFSSAQKMTNKKVTNQDLLEAAGQAFYQGQAVDESKVTYILSAEELRAGHYDYQTFAALRLILTDGPLTSKEILIIAQGLSAEGVMTDEIRALLTGLNDPQTLAAYNRNRLIPRTRMLFEEMESGMRSRRASESMA